MLGDTFTIPDLIEPVVGWRSWRIENGRFCSPDQHTLWSTQGRLTWDGTCRCRQEPLPRATRRRVFTTHVPRPAGASATWTVSGPHHMRAHQSGNGLNVSLWDPNATQWSWSGAPADPASPPTAAAPTAAPSPDYVCLCGINAFASRDLLAASRYLLRRRRLAYAVGTVRLTGEVRQFEQGWRGEKAQVHEVWALGRRAAREVRQAAEASGATYMGVCPAFRWRTGGAGQVMRRLWQASGRCHQLAPKLNMRRLWLASHLALSLVMLGVAQFALGWEPVDRHFLLIMTLLMPAGMSMMTSVMVWSMLDDLVELRTEKARIDAEHAAHQQRMQELKDQLDALGGGKSQVSG